MRVVPTSWMISPPRLIPYPWSAAGMGPRAWPPMASMISPKVSCMCFACFSSKSDHFQWKRSTGMPKRSTVAGSSSQ
jgi:hypothetical protein